MIEKIVTIGIQCNQIKRYIFPYKRCTYIEMQYNHSDLRTRWRILTLDDEPLICKQIGRILGRFVMSSSVLQREDALQAIQKIDFDLALVDYHLP